MLLPHESMQIRYRTPSDSKPEIVQDEECVEIVLVKKFHGYIQDQRCSMGLELLVDSTLMVHLTDPRPEPPLHQLAGLMVDPGQSVHIKSKQAFNINQMK